jgi:hypothetical protein
MGRQPHVYQLQNHLGQQRCPKLTRAMNAQASPHTQGTSRGLLHSTAASMDGNVSLQRCRATCCHVVAVLAVVFFFLLGIGTRNLDTEHSTSLKSSYSQQQTYIVSISFNPAMIVSRNRTLLSFNRSNRRNLDCLHVAPEEEPKSESVQAQTALIMLSVSKTH